jgi:hypothetical protein
MADDIIVLHMERQRWPRRLRPSFWVGMRRARREEYRRWQWLAENMDVEKAQMLAALKAADAQGRGDD